MQAIVIARPGGPDVLEIREVPDPVSGPDEVAVRVRATALNRADLLQRMGRYPAPAGAAPDIPGLEFAGEIVSCGDRVHRLRVGDRVMGLLAGGGYAQQVTLHERLCLPVPPGLDWNQAAAIPEAFLTAYDALLRQARLSVGESVLIHAAGSGVGTAAAQIASICGARTIGLTRTPAKRERLRHLGFGRVLDAGADGLGERIKQSTPDDGVDVVLDMVGATAWSLNIDVLRQRGRLVLVGLLGGTRREVDLSALMTKRLTVVGSVLRSRPLEDKLALVQEFGQRMLGLLAAGRLQPVIDRSYPWERADEAHRRMERNENLGKIVLEVAQ